MLAGGGPGGGDGLQGDGTAEELRRLGLQNELSADGAGPHHGGVGTGLQGGGGRSRVDRVIESDTEGVVGTSEVCGDQGELAGVGGEVDDAGLSVEGLRSAPLSISIVRLLNDEDLVIIAAAVCVHAESQVGTVDQISCWREGMKTCGGDVSGLG